MHASVSSRCAHTRWGVLQPEYSGLKKLGDRPDIVCEQLKLQGSFARVILEALDLPVLKMPLEVMAEAVSFLLPKEFRDSNLLE